MTTAIFPSANDSLKEIARHAAIVAQRQKEVAKYSPQYFADDYWKEDHPGQVGNRSLSYDDPLHVQRFDFLFEKLVRPLSPGRILDAGTGPGLLLERMLNAGIDAIGIDVSSAALLELCQRLTHAHGRVLQTPLSGLPFVDGYFDSTICLDVLEHLIVVDALLAVREICRVTSYEIVCSINLDNPYKFHPTILSRDSWIALFEAIGSFTLNAGKTENLNSQVKERYAEYDFFVFERWPT